MEDILIKAAQLILSLSILVVLHEAGHFLPAKLFGIRVEKFYLFFNPGFSLFKIKRGETEYGVGWLPLGGYVKLSGMIDESMDKEQMEKPAEPWEFRSKPAWQRLIVMLGGVTVNLILGMLIYAGVLFTWGKTYIAAKDVTYGVHVGSAAEEAGFQDGDRITRLNGEPIPSEFTYSMISKELLLNPEISEVTVSNNGTERTIYMPTDFGQMVLASGEKVIFTERVPFIADTILPGSGADEAQMQKGDRLVAVNGESTPYFIDFVKSIQPLKDEMATITVLRDGQKLDLEAKVNEQGKIGVGNQSLTEYFDITTRQYGFFEAIPAGVNEAGRTIKSYIDQFSLVFTKEGISQLGGFGAIGGMFPSVWDWHAFWNLTAFLSLVLAFMNVLPIPALDGGHVMFLLYEMISGRKPGEKFLEYAQMAGMLLLFSLLIFANGNDIFRLFK